MRTLNSAPLQYKRRHLPLMELVPQSRQQKRRAAEVLAKRSIS
jgi:hypothetical protein